MLTDIERSGGVSVKEKSQSNRTKTQADQYAEFHKLNGSSYVETDVTIDRGSKRLTRVISEDN